MKSDEVPLMRYRRPEAPKFLVERWAASLHISFLSFELTLHARTGPREMAVLQEPYDMRTKAIARAW